MLFNSYAYLLLFLPTVVAVFFLLNYFASAVFAKAWLVAASLAFYSWWGLAYLPLIIISIFINYCVGTVLGTTRLSPFNRTALLTAGIGFNVGLLAYFKYANFLVDNINSVAGTSFQLDRIVLPLAISFFTFQKIAYLVDSYRGETQGYNFLNYALFVTFFPQLIAGPIVHHKEVVPQFSDPKNSLLNSANVMTGLSILSIGLFKKVMIADTFAVYASAGFDTGDALRCIEAWTASLGYSFQLYFDFSGYTDMAIGSALILNIRLPINFNSPYRAINIQDFWRRWHITLSRFLRDYVYIPLGGNKSGELSTYFNLFLTFLVGGLWHGASWTFVIWGGLHGAAIVIHRAWSRYGRHMPVALAWFLTFSFVNVAWVFFRAKDLKSAHRVLSSMMNIGDGSLLKMFDLQQRNGTLLIGLGFAIVLFAKTTIEFCTDAQHLDKTTVVSGAALAISLIAMSFVTSGVSEFLYFNF
ncbi:MBOAT family protein [Bradyrhizobium sp. dw_411]|uniref:MBOAT family O-acyltransferase n=1 Tax=Bradyrhizobium sp. dw_411 TaxID=2720082 RepID=UPI001BCC4D7D